MKRFRSLYSIALTALMLFTACQTDLTTEADEPDTPNEDGSISVHLRVSAGDNATTRAWTDADNAADAEMMNVWTVVAVNSSDNKVVEVFACKPSGEPDQEIDDLVKLPAAGSYRFYSFANMSPNVVMNLLGITSSGSISTRGDNNDPTQGPDQNENPSGGSALGEVSDNGNQTGTSGDPFITDGNTYVSNKVYNFSIDSNQTLTEETANGVVVNVGGNNFDPTATNNHFGAKGIPMSNVQTLTITDGDNVDLIVVRMMAKIELQVYNDRGSDITIESITLTDVTKNTDSNLKMLPTLTQNNTMEATHGDIQPNLNGTPGTGYMTLNYNTAISATANSTTAGTPVKFTFYVNESVTPTNAFKHFFLKIKLTGETEERYVLIDDTNATGKTGSWNYIARNDYRIIPIVLDDYKLDIIPYDFPPIGVYPCSVKEEDGIYTINFHDYGHFHLLPKVTKVSDSSVIPFTATTPDYSSTSWGLVDNDFSQSWGTWADATKTSTATDDGSFYRSGYAVNPPVDGDEVGGFPVWYANTSSPQWDPAGGSDYSPFIFGYIADPGSALSEDKKIYHEFSIYLYKQGMSAPRQMTYRLYMILDQSQMSYSRRRSIQCRAHH